MEFWTEHGILFVIGAILFPRMMLLYFNIIPAGSFGSILGFFLVPRLLLASTLTAAYGDTNPIFISIFWIIAVVLDMLSLILKGKLLMTFLEQLQEMKQMYRIYL